MTDANLNITNVIPESDRIIDVSAPAHDQSEHADANLDGQKPTTEMAEQTYLYKVKMTCGGCSGAITRVLAKAQNEGAGVSSFDVSLENQTVEVKGTIAQDDLTARIAKTGKTILEYPAAPSETASEETPAVVAAEPVAVA